MTVRYSPRIAVKCAASILGTGFLGEGQVFDVSMLGCRLMTPENLKPGDAIKLKFKLPAKGGSISVQLAAVKWVRDFEFGVEFIIMDPDDKERLNALVRSYTNVEREPPRDAADINIWV